MPFAKVKLCNEQPRGKPRGIKTKDNCKSERPKGRGIEPGEIYGAARQFYHICVQLIAKVMPWLISACAEWGKNPCNASSVEAHPYRHQFDKHFAAMENLIVGSALEDFLP